mgnify:CR=1 FL=1
MQRNIILISMIIVFSLSIWLGELFLYSNKPDTIYDLEGEQKIIRKKQRSHH